MMRSLLACLLAAVPLAAAADVSVEVEAGNLMRIRNGGLTRPAIERIQEMFRRHPEVALIELENVPGGLTLAESRLYGSFYPRKVIVKGYCMSACAVLAMSARRVSMHRESMLVFHGMFDIFTGQWRAESLHQIQWLASRLPTVDPAAIGTALSSNDREKVGLVIEAPGTGNLVSVRLCNPAPDNCRTVRYMGPGESPISIAR